MEAGCSPSQNAWAALALALLVRGAAALLPPLTLAALMAAQPAGARRHRHASDAATQTGLWRQQWQHRQPCARKLVEGHSTVCSFLCMPSNSSCSRLLHYCKGARRNGRPAWSLDISYLVCMHRLSLHSTVSRSAVGCRRDKQQHADHEPR